MSGWWVLVSIVLFGLGTVICLIVVLDDWLHR